MSAGQAHVAGVAVDWRLVFSGARQVELPTYAFHRRRFWLPPSEIGGSDLGGVGVADAAQVGVDASLGCDPEEHGTAVRAAGAHLDVAERADPPVRPAAQVAQLQALRGERVSGRVEAMPR